MTENKKSAGLTKPMGTLEKLGFGCFSMSNNVVFQFKSSFYLFFLTNIIHNHENIIFYA